MNPGYPDLFCPFSILIFSKNFGNLETYIQIALFLYEN